MDQHHEIPTAPTQPTKTQQGSPPESDQHSTKPRKKV